jgi:hypothetical protein
VSLLKQNRGNSSHFSRVPERKYHFLFYAFEEEYRLNHYSLRIHVHKDRTFCFFLMKEFYKARLISWNYQATLATALLFLFTLTLANAQGPPSSPVTATIKATTGDGINTNPDIQPAPTIGTLTSLLQPPPGYIYNPPLTEQQIETGKALSQMRQGTATIVYREQGSVTDGQRMNCGLGYMNSHFSNFNVGVSSQLYGKGELCGVCIQLYCVDSVCENPLDLDNYGVFMISDSCTDCALNDLTISTQGMFNVSGGVDYYTTPSLQVAWELIPCTPLIDGGIRVLPLRDNSEVMLGLNFSNLKVVLRAVRINGLNMQPTDFGYWVIHTPGERIAVSPPYVIDMLGVNGEVVRAEVATLAAQDLGVNFGP